MVIIGIFVYLALFSYGSAGNDFSNTRAESICLSLFSLCRRILFSFWQGIQYIPCLNRNTNISFNQRFLLMLIQSHHNPSNHVYPVSIPFVPPIINYISHVRICKRIKISENSNGKSVGKIKYYLNGLNENWLLYFRLALFASEAINMKHFIVFEH